MISKLFSAVFVLGLAFSIAGTGCKKDDEDTPATTSGGGTTTTTSGGFTTGTWKGTGITTTSTDPGGCGGNHTDSLDAVIVVTSASGSSVVGTQQVYDTGDANPSPPASFNATVSSDSIEITLAGTACTQSGTSEPKVTLKMNGANMTLTMGGTSCEPCSGPATETPWAESGSGTLTKQ